MLVVENICEKITQLSYDVRDLSKFDIEDSENEKVKSTTNRFNLKTALSLLPIMADDESVTKQLIDNIE